MGGVWGWEPHRLTRVVAGPAGVLVLALASWRICVYCTGETNPLPPSPEGSETFLARHRKGVILETGSGNFPPRKGKNPERRKVLNNGTVE